MSLIQAFCSNGGPAERLAALAIRRRLSRTVAHLEDAVEEARSRQLPEGTPAQIPVRDQPVVFDISSIDPEVREQVLGPHGLPFCCFWSRRWNTLELAQEQMLKTIAQRAKIEDGMVILNVSPFQTGLPQWIRENFPDCRTTEQSVRLISSSPDDQALEGGFDRILAIETPQPEPSFSSEVDKLAKHLRVGGKLFVQRKCHRKCVHAVTPAESASPQSSFLPGADFAPRETGRLDLIGHWELSGEHYERTAGAWLAGLRQVDRQGGSQSGNPGRSSYRRWTFELLSTAKMFGLYRGQEWWVSQYLLGSSDPAGSSDRPATISEDGR